MRASILIAKRARALRREMTPPEVILWQRLRGGALGAKFRRQHAAGKFILDFYCPAARLAVEVDGANHFLDEQAAKDARRTEWLAAQGIRVLRVPASAVLDAERRDGLLREIRRALETPPP